MIKFSKEKLRELIMEYSNLTKTDKILFSDNKITKENVNNFLKFIEGQFTRDNFINSIDGWICQLKFITSKHNSIEYGFGVPVNFSLH